MNKLVKLIRERLSSHGKRVPVIIGILGVNHVLHVCPSVDLLGWGLIALAVSAITQTG